MNLDKIKEFFSNLSPHELHAGAAVLVGLVVLIFGLKAAKFFSRLLLVLIAIGLFAGAWWWYARR